MDVRFYLLGIRKYYEGYSVTTILWDNCHLGCITDNSSIIKVKCGRCKEFETTDRSLAIKKFAKSIKRGIYHPIKVYYKEIEVDMLDSNTFERVL